MGLLAEIQNDAISDDKSVSALLRKCLVLAHNLDSDLLEDWVRYELNGYPTDVEVPAYRRLLMIFKVSGANPAYQINNAPVATAAVVSVSKIDDIHYLKYRHAIGTINAQELKDAELMHVDMMNFAHLLPGKVTERSYSIHAFWGEISASMVLGIVDAVRNRVLEFVLALSKKYPNAGEIGGITIKEPTVEKTLNQIFNTTINGSAGVIGNADSATVNITVNQGNFAELRQQLTQSGINEDDIKELEAAIASEPQIGSDKKYGPKVGQWVGKMLGKAASGAWNVGLHVGSAVLEKALLSYYGL